MDDFDYIIVGAGSAGCVLAGRLSEDSDKRILVLEAGGPDGNWLLKVPLGVAKVWSGDTFNWSYMSEPEPNVDQRRIFHPRGKVLGGSSSINMMAYVRGHRRDYDRWRQMGLAGWSYADVLPYFKRAERYEPGANTYHGGDGPLGVRRNAVEDPTFDAFFAAGEEIGYPTNEDYNGAEQEGFARMQYTIRDGRRCSAAVAYLHPAAQRPNVRVETGVHVTRLLIENGRAVGVAYMQGGDTREVRTEGEVILSAGSINSPQILMLSGVGPADHLREHGLETQLDQPGVGSNLQDHPAVTVEYAHTRRSRLHDQLRYDRLALSMLRAWAFGTGFASWPPGGMTAFVKSAPEFDIPDIQMFCRNGSMHVREWFPGIRSPGLDGFMIRACHLRPESRGTVRLATADPFSKARIRNNFLATETDRRVLRQSVRIMRDVIASKAFQGIAGEEVGPGKDVQSDDEVDAYVRRNLDTVYHPIGTCRFGSDEDSVVDPEFRLRGIEGLRVVDASVMPDLVGGNINAAVIMIAEKASDIIRGRPALPAAEGV